MKGRYSDQLKARALRKRGYLLSEICEKLDVSKSSVSVWVRDVELSVSGEKRISKKKLETKNFERLNSGREEWSSHCRSLREQWREEGRLAALKNDPLHIMGCMLYWAEGAKDRCNLVLANSDVAMVKKFVRFLKETFNVSGEDFSIRISVYLNYLSMDEVVQYWRVGADLKEATTQRHNIDPYNKNKVRIEERKNRINKLPYGVCAVRLKKSTRALQHIYGALEVYAGVYLDPHRNRSTQTAAN